MKYALFLYDDEAAWVGMSEAEQGEVFAQHMAYSQALEEAGAMVSGEPLDPSISAKTVRAGTVEDGPYADTKEQLGGFYIIDVADMDTAVDWAKRCPLGPGGSIEIRPVPDYGG